MKKDAEKAAIDPLDNEIPIKLFSKFPVIAEGEELIVLAQETLFGCIIFLTCLASVVFYLINAGFLALFIFNLIIITVGYLWNYKYNIRKKPILKISKAGITHKNSFYEWYGIQNMVCAEEYNGERGVYDATYIKFNYGNSIKTIYIGGLSKTKDEIIHYICSFQQNNGAAIVHN